MDDNAGGTPRTRVSRLDLITLVLVCAAPVPALALNVGRGPLWSQIMVWGPYPPLDALLLGATVAGGVRLLGRRSMVRARRGRVPRRYHAVLLVWVVCVATAPIVVGVQGVRHGSGFGSMAPWYPRGGFEPLMSQLTAGPLWTVAVLARFLGPVALLVMRAVDVRADRRAAPERVWAPWEVRDLVVLAVVWAAPLLGWAAKSMTVGMGSYFLLWASPVFGLAIAHGIWVFHSVLGAGSRVRARRGAVPRGYRTLAWVWSVAVFLPGFVLPEFGVDCTGVCQWRPRSALELLLQAEVPPGPAFAVVLIAPVVALVIQVLVHVRRNRDRRPRAVEQPSPAPPDPSAQVATGAL